ncbi:MAG: Yip1 family protein [Gaiellaceae bacterium]
MDPDREWWLRVPAVLLSPRAVFTALRNEEREDLEARSEPVLALTCLAGIAVALGTGAAETLYDHPDYDAALVAVWAVIAGGFTAFAGYFVVGGALYLGARGLGGEGTFRRARHVLAFAVAPLALSLLVLWPVRLAAFGTDLFRRGGSDEGDAGRVFDALELGFALWAALLLLVGVRAVHGWTWPRSLGALGLVALFLAAFRYLL